MSTKRFYFIVTLFLLITVACENTPSETSQDAEPSKELSEADKALVKDIMKEEVVETEPQATFDQSQLTNDVLGLCVKFKALDGADRQGVFNKFETILPSCPVDLLEDNIVEPNIDEAVQVMSVNDLKELLGEPNEVREDGMLVYNLLADKTYRVLFLTGDSGAVVCRLYEGAS